LLAWGFNSGGKDKTDGMKVVDLDIDVQKDLISDLRATNHIVMCYFSAGSLEPWRPDCQANKDLWKSAAAGPMSGWDEAWLDITKLSLLQQLMTPRFQKAVDYGCHAIEPDNTDCYDNKDCWGAMGYSSGSKVIPYQITYNKWLSQIAHQYGLAIALKNTVDLVPQLGSSFDCAVNEQCQSNQECDAYNNFVNSGKAVFQVEYDSDSSYCDGASQYSLQTKYCPSGGGNSGICSSNGKWTNCFQPTIPLPPTRWTNGSA